MRSHYKRVMDELALSPEAKGRIQDKLAYPQRRVRFRPAAVAAAAAAILVLGTSAMASGVFYHDVPAAIAQRLEPVQLSCTSQDITITVQSATVENGVFRAYITMEDELDSERLAQGVEFYDFYKISTPYRANETISGYQALGYDEESGTYGFLIQVQAKDEDGRKLDLSKDKLTFSVQQLLLEQEETEPEFTLDWDALPDEAPAVRKYIFGRHLVEGRELPLAEDGTALILQPGALNIPAADGAVITAAGFLDGVFHLQLHFDNAGPDDHGQLFLIGPDGEKVENCGAMYTREEDGGKYLDTLYDITREELSGCTLAGKFKMGGYLLEGDWKVTFTLTEEP